MIIKNDNGLWEEQPVEDCFYHENDDFATDLSNGMAELGIVIATDESNTVAEKLSIKAAGIGFPQALFGNRLM